MKVKNDSASSIPWKEVNQQIYNWRVKIISTCQDQNIETSSLNGLTYKRDRDFFKNWYNGKKRTNAFRNLTVEQLQNTIKVHAQNLFRRLIPSESPLKEVLKTCIPTCMA